MTADPTRRRRAVLTVLSTAVALVSLAFPPTDGAPRPEPPAPVPAAPPATPEVLAGIDAG